MMKNTPGIKKQKGRVIIDEASKFRKKTFPAERPPQSDDYEFGHIAY